MRAYRHPVLRGLAAGVVAVTLFGGVAQAQSDREVVNRLSKLEQDLQRLQKQLPPARSTTAATPGAVPDAAADGSSDLTVRMLALEHIVEQLTGQIEESRFTASRTARQVQVLQDDLSLRLARIEQSLGLTGAMPAPAQQSQVPPPAAQPVAPQVATATPARPLNPVDAATEPPAPAPGAPMSQPVMSQPTSRPGPVQPPPKAAPSPLAAVQTPSAGASAEGLAAKRRFCHSHRRRGTSTAAGSQCAADPAAARPRAAIAAVGAQGRARTRTGHINTDGIGTWCRGVVARRRAQTAIRLRFRVS